MSVKPRPQTAGRAWPAAVDSFVVVRAIAQVTAMSVLDKEVEERLSPPSLLPIAKVAALSIHIRGVWMAIRRSIRDRARAAWP